MRAAPPYESHDLRGVNYKNQLPCLPAHDRNARQKSQILPLRQLLIDPPPKVQWLQFLNSHGSQKSLVFFITPLVCRNSPPPAPSHPPMLPPPAPERGARRSPAPTPDGLSFAVGGCADFLALRRLVSMLDRHIGRKHVRGAVRRCQTVAGARKWHLLPREPSPSAVACARGRRALGSHHHMHE